MADEETKTEQDFMTADDIISQREQSTEEKPIETKIKEDLSSKKEEPKKKGRRSKVSEKDYNFIQGKLAESQENTRKLESTVIELKNQLENLSKQKEEVVEEEDEKNSELRQLKERYNSKLIDDELNTRLEGTKINIPKEIAINHLKAVNKFEYDEEGETVFFKKKGGGLHTVTDAINQLKADFPKLFKTFEPDDFYAGEGSPKKPSDITKHHSGGKYGRTNKDRTKLYNTIANI